MHNSGFNKGQYLSNSVSVEHYNSKGARNDFSTNNIQLNPANSFIWSNMYNQAQILEQLVLPAVAAASSAAVSALIDIGTFQRLENSSQGIQNLGAPIDTDKKKKRRRRRKRKRKRHHKLKLGL